MHDFDKSGDGVVDFEEFLASINYIVDSGKKKKVGNSAS